MLGQAQSQTRTLRRNDAPPLRILVADDDRDTVDTLTAILRDDGHVVHGVYGGKTVRPAAMLLRPDALIVDIQIPGRLCRGAVDPAFFEGARPLLIAISGFW